MSDGGGGGGSDEVLFLACLRVLYVVLGQHVRTGKVRKGWGAVLVLANEEGSWLRVEEIVIVRWAMVDGYGQGRSSRRLDGGEWNCGCSRRVHVGESMVCVA